ncbi:hypothetical protein FS837_009243 [Tulasnella sp. UAMH 9824]|nr:hypothetical protein FS837_009243 [Tulasnella sp. UAMH 9824]
MTRLPKSQAPQAAITDLPPEVIATILQDLYHTSIGLYYSDLICVTHSNSYLRQAAINASNLWTSIEITDKPASFELAKTCLNRSGGQAIDIYIRMNKRLKSRLNGLLAMVTYAVSRLRSLAIRVCLSDLNHEWPQINACFQQLVAPHLRYLRVEVAMFHEPFTLPHQTLPIPQGADKLRTLSLNNLTPDVSTPSILSSVKSITFSSKWFWASPYQTLVEALRASYSVEELTLARTAVVSYGPRRTADSLPTIPPINLPRLHHLTMKNVENDFVAFLLSNIVAPELEVVVLQQTEPLDTANHNLYFDWKRVPVSSGFHSVIELHVNIGVVAVHHMDQIAIFLARLFPNVERVYMPWRAGRELVQEWTSYWNPLNAPPAGDKVSLWPELRQIVLTGQDCVAGSGYCPYLLEDILLLLQTRQRCKLLPLELLRFEACESVKTWEGYRGACHRIRELLSSLGALDVTPREGS